MKIKDVMVSALRRVGREDLAANVEGGGKPTGEGAEVVKTMLYCINAAEAELARYYYPLIYTETLSSGNGYYFFESFAFTPVKIISVKSGGEEVDYRVYANFLFTESRSAEITYMYLPYAKDVDDESEFGMFGDGNVTALGAAAEYCLMCGETKMAEVWETRYHAAIERALKDNRPALYIPPRRWV